MADPRIARILDKLARVRAQGIETFGAESHGYELAPVLSETDLATLEARSGRETPEAFRVFLREAGASGAGPYYGLLGPEHWDLAASDVPELSESLRGAITLADQGCGNYVLLVTSGSERGRVVYVNDGGETFFPENRDFLDWYERWLDELLWGFQHHWFGVAMPGDEATLAAAARASDGPRRRDALDAMHQLPAVAPATVEVIALRLADADADVRAAAVNLVNARKLVGELDAPVRALVDDADPRVRLAALRAIITTERWHDEARGALSDTAEDVHVLAFQKLAEAGLLDEAQILERLVPERSQAVRDAAIAAAFKRLSLPVFDAALALAPALPDPHGRCLSLALACVRDGLVDDARRDAACELVIATIEAAAGPRSPTVAVHGLGALAGTHPRAFDALLALTRHPVPWVRFDAAGALGALGSEPALPALRELTADPAMPVDGGARTTWSVGEQAKKAIAKIEQRLASRA